MKQTLVIKLMVSLLLSGISVGSLANEAALYDLAPEGSAFIRIIDLREQGRDQSASNKLRLKFQNKRLSAEAYCSASEFIYVKPGEYRQKINGMLWEGTLEPNQAYSLVVANNLLKLLKDFRAEDSRRGVLAVYNFSGRSDLGLNTALSARSVFAGIPQGQSVARAINPLKSAFVVVGSSAGERENLAATDPMIFQAGVLSSLFICAEHSGIVARWANSMGDL